MKLFPSPSTQDLEDIHLGGSSLWPILQGRRLFISGGTGFFGRWLLEAFHHLIHHHSLDITITVLSRDPEAFFEKAPHFRNHRRIHFLKGDVTSFDFPSEHFDYVIHAATEASNKLNAEHPLLMADTIVSGTRRMLDFAVQSGVERFLLTSSGAVYGRQPPELSHIPEDYPGAPNPCDPLSAYAEGKRMAELLCGIYHKEHHLECQIARCFAFVGPYLPLDGHFAAGNFLRNALMREPIVIQGDGTPYRSYLYGTDLVIWILTILLQGRSMHPYHVGSEEAVSIAELAQLISKLSPNPSPIRILGTPRPNVFPERYVPANKRTCEELKIRMQIGMEEALLRTWRFHTG